MFDKFKEAWREAKVLPGLQRELAGYLPEESERKALLEQFRTISKNVKCPHNESHVLTFVNALLNLPADIEGDILEAGCFKGGSTAKFSLVAKKLNRSLVVYDSFEGLPENQEEHKKSIDGYSIEGWFEGEAFCGSLDEVKNNVQSYGHPEVCRFEKGWFCDTLPHLDSKICAAYIDVDLAESTRDCLKFIYPKIVPGGVLVSQDGDFPLVIDVFKDEAFWEEEVGCAKPEIVGLGSKKMISIYK